MVLFASYLNPVTVSWMIFILYWTVSAFFVKKSMTNVNIRSAILWRLVLFILVVAFFNLDKSGAFATLSFISQSLFNFTIVGSIITVLGLATAIWARFALGNNWSGYVTYKKEQELVTSGPYRLVRHPIYTGLLVMMIGAFLYYGYIFIVMIALIAGFFLFLRMGREEKIMIQLFGKRYRDYMKRTKRLIPWIY